MISISLQEILKSTEGTLVFGNESASLVISTIKEPAEAKEDSVSFFISGKFLDDLSQCKAPVLVVKDTLWEKLKTSLPSTVKAVVSSKDPYLGLARLSSVYAKKDVYADWRAEHFSADKNVHPTAKVAASAKISFTAVVCENAKIGERTVLMPGVVVGPEVFIGDDCVLFPGVILYPRTQIGSRVRLHAHVVLGADGFGYAKGPRGSEKIWHIGKVVVGNDVEIGANTCIDRGTIKDSIVENFVKIDNLVQVGHNGHLKAHAIVCAQAGMAGNVTVGMGTILAGQAGIADKLNLGDGSIVGPQAGISKDVAPGDVMMSSLMARPRKEWWKLNAYFDRLPELFDRIKKLEGEKK